jgi:hypothetical protein
VSKDISKKNDTSKEERRSNIPELGLPDMATLRPGPQEASFAFQRCSLAKMEPAIKVKPLF